MTGVEDGNLGMLTVERVTELADAARRLVEAHDRANPNRDLPSLNERDAYYILLGVIARPMFETALRR